VSVRWFNRSPIARGIAGTAVILGMAAFLARMVTKVQAGQGLVPYMSSLGIPAYPLGAVIFAAVLLFIAAVGHLLGWWSSSRSGPDVPRH
jgi:hypothetical protein